WYRVNRPPPSATPSPSNPAGEKRKKTKRLKRIEAGQNKSASDMAQGVVPGHVGLLSDKRCSPTNGPTHASACFKRAPVSILILAYHAEVWDSAAIDSVLGQVWRQKEIIVVDAGCTDGILTVAR